MTHNQSKWQWGLRRAFKAQLRLGQEIKSRQRRRRKKAETGIVLKPGQLIFYTPPGCQRKTPDPGNTTSIQDKLYPALFHRHYARVGYLLKTPSGSGISTVAHFYGLGRENIKRAIDVFELKDEADFTPPRAQDFLIETVDGQKVFTSL